nr:MULTISPECIES: deoxyribodipyrimidine photo-lyase [unclassified Actinopolyspora]
MAVFVLDTRLIMPAGPPRRTFLYRCLRALDARLDGRLLALERPPETALPELAQKAGAGSVYVSGETNPYGHRRDERVERVMGGYGRRLRVDEIAVRD